MDPQIVYPPPLFDGPAPLFFPSPGQNGCIRCGLKECDHSFYHEGLYLFNVCEACGKEGDHWVKQCPAVPFNESEWEPIRDSKCIALSPWKPKKIKKRKHSTAAGSSSIKEQVPIKRKKFKRSKRNKSKRSSLIKNQVVGADRTAIKRKKQIQENQK